MQLTIQKSFFVNRFSRITAGPQLSNQSPRFYCESLNLCSDRDGNACCPKAMCCTAWVLQDALCMLLYVLEHSMTKCISAERNKAHWAPAPEFLAFWNPDGPSFVSIDVWGSDLYSWHTTLQNPLSPHSRLSTVQADHLKASLGQFIAFTHALFIL